MRHKPGLPFGATEVHQITFAVLVSGNDHE
jgi:hypothetical protein